MLDKTRKPAFEEIIEYCGVSGELWLQLEAFLQENYNLQKLIRFPYGGDYGWAVKYAHGKKHICDVFAEAGAFTVFFRIDNKDIGRLSPELSDYSKDTCNKKYPCGEGGWVRYRVAEKEQLNDGELFTKAHYNWTGTSSLGQYCISATASHYEWAMKKLKEQIKALEGK